MVGLDPYGLTAAVLAAGATAMAEPGYGVTGVVSPVQAMGLAPLRAELTRVGVQIRVFGPGGVQTKSETGAEGRA